MFKLLKNKRENCSITLASEMRNIVKEQGNHVLESDITEFYNWRLDKIKQRASSGMREFTSDDLKLPECVGAYRMTNTERNKIIVKRTCRLLSDEGFDASYREYGRHWLSVSVNW